MIKTVLGNIADGALGITLPHEHICCYSEYFYKMGGERYLDKALLASASIRYLKELKQKNGLCSFIDCTPVNIGRDIDLLKRVSYESGVHIIASTGFYYTREPLLDKEADFIAEYLSSDAERVNAGVIKAAVEYEEISPFDKKLLKAYAIAHKNLGLPIVLHTNARNKNALPALEILLSNGVKPSAVTVGHLSDTEALDYIHEIANLGCYIGLDRMYGNVAEEYISKKIDCIRSLCDKGYADKILLSHDAIFFNGFDKAPRINEKPRFAYVFENILPRLDKDIAEKITIKNPQKMLSGE